MIFFLFIADAETRSDFVYFHYGITGVARLNFLSQEKCSVTYLGNAQLHSWVKGSENYLFYVLFHNQNDQGVYRNLSLTYAVKESKNITFERGLQWASFCEMTQVSDSRCQTFSIFVTMVNFVFFVFMHKYS